VPVLSPLKYHLLAWPKAKIARVLTHSVGTRLSIRAASCSRRFLTQVSYIATRTQMRAIRGLIRSAAQRDRTLAPLSSSSDRELLFFANWILGVVFALSTIRLPLCPLAIVALSNNPNLAARFG